MINIYMRNLFKSFKTAKGFTLIELLVVIGILGVLAAALIATIDPFEQIKKAQDTNVKNSAVEFVNASIRYYTTHNTLPWADTSITGCSAAGTTRLDSQTGCLNALISDGELKTGFTTVTSILTSIYINGTTNGATACFQPVSKSQQRDANTKYAQSGALTTGCTSQAGGSSTSCYWCAQ